MAHFSDSDTDRFTSGNHEFLKYYDALHPDLISTIHILAAIDQSTPNDIASLRILLPEELKNAGELFENTWKTSIDVYSKKKDEGYSGLNQPDYPDEYHIVLIFYVMKFCYKQFNEATRNLKSVEDVKDYPYKVLYKLLLKAIKEMPGVPADLPEGTELYRGISGNVDLKEGQIVAFQHFVSTSREMNVSLRYTRNANPRVLFVFNGTGEYSTCLDHHPPQANNKECLIWPTEAYYVHKVTMEQHEGKPVKVIHLKP